MTYRIEITADSLAELAGRVSALAAQLQATTAPAAYVAPKAQKKTAAVMAELAALVATAPEAAPEPAAVLHEVPPFTLTVEPVFEPAPEPAAVVEYDVQRDILPRVLRFVELRGRDAVEALLAQFGVARASHVPVEQRGELVALLDEAIAG
jgi:cell pole-organizing protein PopZ